MNAMKRQEKSHCPICRKPTLVDYKPFCSKRCANIDLGRWLNEDYAVPAVEPPDEWSESGGEPEY